MDQLTQFNIVSEHVEAIKNHRDFSHVIQVVGSEKFGKSDLNFYFRTLGEIQDRIDSSRSLVKTFINSIGQFTKPETKEAISSEARERLESQFLEILLLLKEIALGQESEFMLLEKKFRKRNK